LSSIVDLVFEQSLVNDSSANTAYIYVVIADQQKEGRDDSMKHFSIQPHLCIFTGGKVCRVELCIELLYPYLVSLLFADLLSLHLVTFLVLNSCVLLKDMIGLATQPMLDIWRLYIGKMCISSFICPHKCAVCLLSIDRFHGACYPIGYMSCDRRYSTHVSS